MRHTARLQANVTAPYQVSGNFFYMESAPSALVQVRFFRGDRRLTEEIDATERGWQAAFVEPYDRIELLSAVAQDVTFHAVHGRVGVNVFSGQVTVDQPTTLETVADVNLGAGATQVLAADAARRRAHVSNLAANANNMRVGDANVAAARGLEIQPGQTVTIEGTAAIHVFGTANDDVGITVEKD